MDSWFVEFKRKLDELDARSERRWAALEQRGAAVKLRTVGLEQLGVTQLVVADNWGGLFDEIPNLSDESVPVPAATVEPIIPDNWGGLFEQPDHTSEERGHDFTADVVFTGLATSVQIRISELEAEPVWLLGFRPVPEERIVDPVFASSDSAPDNTPTEASSTCLTQIASSAIKEIVPEEFPLQLQEREEVVEVDEKDLPSTGSEVLKAVIAESNANQLLTEHFRVSALDRQVGNLSAPRPDQLRQPRRAPPRPPRLRRPRRAPRRPPWLYRPRSPRTRGPRRAPPWWRHPLRRLIWRPPWRLASFDQRPRRCRHRVRGLTFVPAWGGTSPTPTATGAAEVTIALVAPPRFSGSARVFSCEHALGAFSVDAVNAEGYARSFSTAAAVLSAEEVARDIKDVSWRACPVGSLIFVCGKMRLPATAAVLSGGSLHAPSTVPKPDYSVFCFDAAVHHANHLFHGNDFTNEFDRGKVDLDVKLMGSARYCATSGQLVIECKARQDSHLVFDKMPRRYNTIIYPPHCNGVVLFGHVSVVQQAREVFEEMAKLLSEILWPPPMHISNKLCTTSVPPVQFLVAAESIQSYFSPPTCCPWDAVLY